MCHVRVELKKHQKHTKKENLRKIQYQGPNNAWPGKCECSTSEMALGASCESGQEKLKKKCQKHTKNKTKKSTILGPKQHVRTHRLGLGNVDVARQG